MIEKFAPIKSGVIGSKKIVDDRIPTHTENSNFSSFLRDLETNIVNLTVNLNDSSNDNTADTKRPKVLIRKIDEIAFDSPVLMRHVQIEANFSLLPLLVCSSDRLKSHWIFPDSSVSNGGHSKTPLRTSNSLSLDEFWSSSSSRHVNTAIVTPGSTPEQYAQFVKTMYLSWQKASSVLMSQLISHHINHFHVLGESSYALMSKGSDIFVSAYFQSPSSSEPHSPDTMTCTMIGVSTSLMNRLAALGCSPSVLAVEVSALSLRERSTLDRMEQSSRGVDVVICGRLPCQLAMECLKETVLDYLMKGGAVEKMPLLCSDSYFEGGTPHHTKVVVDDCQHRFEYVGETQQGASSVAAATDEEKTHKVHLSGSLVTLSDVREVMERLITLGREAEQSISASAEGNINNSKRKKSPSAAYSYVQKSVHFTSSLSTVGYNAALWRTTAAGNSSASATAPILSNPMSIIVNKAPTAATTTTAIVAPTNTDVSRAPLPRCQVDLVVQTDRMISFLYGESQARQRLSVNQKSKAAVSSAGSSLSSSVSCGDVLLDIYWDPTLRDEMMLSSGSAKKRALSGGKTGSGESGSSNGESNSVGEEYVEVTLMPQPAKRITRRSDDHIHSGGIKPTSSVNTSSGSSFKAPADSEETVLEPMDYKKRSKYAIDYVH